jgi:hypothetical protein
MTNICASLAVVAMGLSLAAGGAHAGQLWPSSVVGTWHAVADQSSLTITISSQAATGKCRQIAGTIVDNTGGGATSNLLGFYCPTSGRFHFVRNDAASRVTYQDYSGNVSDNGRRLYMGGIFAEVFTPANVGEYSFLASK